MHGIPYVNGVQHSWADIVISIAGVPFTGVRAIKYGESRVIDNIYGIGAYPVGRGYGNIEATASITLLMSDVLALSDAAPLHRLDDIAPFDIPVSYIPLNGAKIVHDVIKNAQFKGNSRDWTQGDTSEEVELDLIVSHIDWGGTK